MSRHNRRRSRGGRKHATASRASTLIMSDDGLANPSIYYSSSSDSDCSQFSSAHPAPDFVDRIPQLPPNMPLPRSSAPSARVWHNRYMAWQARKQHEEQMMKEERKRIFGAQSLDPGRGAGVRSPPPGLGFGEDEPQLSDDEAEDLEAKMMDYFHGLDWLV